jgi:hypothetical protein
MKERENVDYDLLGKKQLWKWSIVDKGPTGAVVFKTNLHIVEEHRDIVLT